MVLLTRLLSVVDSVVRIGESEVGLGASVVVMFCLCSSPNPSPSLRATGTATGGARCSQGNRKTNM